MVNLVVFSLLLTVGGWHYVPTTIVSFAIAVTSNNTWNRLWTFRRQRRHATYQEARFVAVSTLALGANVPVLTVFTALGTLEITAQAIAIILVIPLNFLGDKLWSFRIER